MPTMAPFHYFLASGRERFMIGQQFRLMPRASVDETGIGHIQRRLRRLDAEKIP